MKNLTKLSKKKLIVTGNHYEFREYTKPYGYNFAPRSASEGSSVRKADGEKQRASLARSRQNVYRIVEGNRLKKNTFATLTFKKNEKNLKIANRELAKFIMRLRYHTGWIPRYLAVPEFQKRGAIHYHIVFFGCPYIKKEKFAKLWGHGFVDIKQIKKIKNLSAYISKYITKQHTDKRLFNFRVYLASRNLNFPMIYRDEKNIDKIFNSDRLEFVSSYVGEHLKIKCFRKV